MCCVEYTLCTDARSYSLDAIPEAAAMNKQDSQCSKDYVGIEGEYLCFISKIDLNREYMHENQ